MVPRGVNRIGMDETMPRVTGQLDEWTALSQNLCPWAGIANKSK
jgi:hypothetical protein